MDRVQFAKRQDAPCVKQKKVDYAPNSIRAPGMESVQLANLARGELGSFFGLPWQWSAVLLSAVAMRLKESRSKDAANFGKDMR